jgi:hypothetical protein
MSKLVLELIGVEKGYVRTGRPPRLAIQNLSLRVAEGDVLGVLGPAGAGKSTLLRLMAARMRPTAGQVVRHGRLVLLDEPGLPLPSGAPAIVLATRSPALALKACTRFVLLEQGHLRADRPAADLREFAEQDWYRIRVQGHLSPHIAVWFDGYDLAEGADGSTTISGGLPDQAALHGLLIRIRNLGLPLLEVARTAPDWRPTGAGYGDGLYLRLYPPGTRRRRRVPGKMSHDRAARWPDAIHT